MSYKPKLLTTSEGGTGLPSAGSSGNVLTSDGSIWTSAAPAGGGVTWTDVTATTLAAGNGYFCTAAGTYNLPSSPSQGDTIYIICDTAGAVVIDAPGTDLIRNGNQSSSAGGTLTSSAIGNSLILVFRASNTTWIANSSNGTWLTA